MTVVYCATENYFPRLKVAIRSLLYNTPKVNVIVISNKPFGEGGRIKNIVMDGLEYFKDSPNRYSKWTIFSLMRLAFHRIFPELNQVLYLDCDCIVCRDITQLLEWDMKGQLVAGCAEPQKSNEMYSYLNAGVLLLNLKGLRESGLGDRMIEEINHNKYDFPDQDCLNLVLAGHKYILGDKWNMCEWTGWTPNPMIMHYAAYPNYMQGQCKHPEIIRKYLRMDTDIYSM